MRINVMVKSPVFRKYISTALRFYRRPTTNRLCQNKTGSKSLHWKELSSGLPVILQAAFLVLYLARLLFSRKEEGGFRKRNVEEVIWNEIGCNDEFEILLVDEKAIVRLHQEVGNRKCIGSHKNLYMHMQNWTWI
jgi:hypothetical protein